MPSKCIEAAELGELAGNAAHVELRLGSEDLIRLADFLVRDDGDDERAPILTAAIDFGEGPEGFPCLRLTISGELKLRCQRCLRSLAWPVAMTSRLTVLQADAQAGQLAAPFDSVVTENGSLRLEIVVEDEVLAALPMAPMHGSRAARGEAGAPMENLAGLNPRKQAAHTHRPFAALASMVDGGDTKEQ